MKYVHVWWFIHTVRYIHIYTYVCTCTLAYVYMYVFVSLPICIQIYTYYQQQQPLSTNWRRKSSTRFLVCPILSMHIFRGTFSFYSNKLHNFIFETIMCFLSLPFFLFVSNVELQWSPATVSSCRVPNLFPFLLLYTANNTSSFNLLVSIFLSFFVYSGKS